MKELLSDVTTKVQAVALLGCVTSLIVSVASRTAFWMVFPFTNGICMGVLLMTILEKYAHLRNQRAMGRLPIEAHVIDENDEERIIAVTRQDGEIVMINLPVDYDPEDDNGERLIRLVIPEFFSDDPQLRGDE